MTLEGYSKKVTLTVEDINGLIEQSITMSRQAFNNVSYIRCIQNLLCLLN